MIPMLVIIRLAIQFLHSVIHELFMNTVSDLGIFCYFGMVTELPYMPHGHHALYEMFLMVLIGIHGPRHRRPSLS